MKTTLFVVTIALLLSLAGNWYFWNQSNKLSNLEQQSQEKDWERVKYIQELRATAATAAARIFELESDRVRIRDSAKVSQSAAKREIARHEKTTEQLRPEVTARLDSVPVLKAFVASLDSTIHEQKELIQGLELAHSAEIINLDAIIREMGHQNVAQVAISETLGQVVTNLETENKKQKRKTVFWKITSGVLAAGVVIISLKE